MFEHFTRSLTAGSGFLFHKGVNGACAAVDAIHPDELEKVETFSASFRRRDIPARQTVMSDHSSDFGRLSHLSPRNYGFGTSQGGLRGVQNP